MNPVFRSLTEIEMHIREKLTVTALAESIHISKYHYQRLFREAMGESVMRYVSRRRMALAAAELVETNASVLEIALRYGYDSHDGFTRAFRAAMGVTPMDYRKYGLHPPNARKEYHAMPYTRPMDEIARELRALIVQAKELAIRTRQGSEITVPAYAAFWALMAARTEAMVETLSSLLDRSTDILGQPDAISTRFRIIQAIEDAAFRAGATAFQAGLMTARAMPEHRDTFQPLCQQYAALADAARLKTEKLSAFFQELAALILQDIRAQGTERLTAAVQAGRAAAEPLEDPSLPYGYIAEALKDLAEELSAMPLGEVGEAFLEDCLFRLEGIALAADTDVLRCPTHRSLFAGIGTFRERLEEALAFFRHLNLSPPKETMRSDRDLDGYTHLFFLKGEMQKLAPLLAPEQRVGLDAVCVKLSEALRLPCTETFETVHEMLVAQAESLGTRGEALRFLAAEIKRAGE